MRRGQCRFTLSVIFFALVAADCPDWAIDLWPSHESAQAALREVLVEDPTFRDLLFIVPISPLGAEGEASEN